MRSSRACACPDSRRWGRSGSKPSPPIWRPSNECAGRPGTAAGPRPPPCAGATPSRRVGEAAGLAFLVGGEQLRGGHLVYGDVFRVRSEENKSEPQSLNSISSAVFCLKKQKAT